MIEMETFIKEYGRRATGNELEIMQLMSEDVNKYEMAEKLGIKYKTLAARINKLRSDLGVKTDPKLALIFKQHGLI